MADERFERALEELLFGGSGDAAGDDWSRAPSRTLTAPAVDEPLPWDDAAFDAELGDPRPASGSVLVDSRPATRLAPAAAPMIVAAHPVTWFDTARGRVEEAIAWARERGQLPWIGAALAGLLLAIPLLVIVLRSGDSSTSVNTAQETTPTSLLVPATLPPITDVAGVPATIPPAAGPVLPTPAPATTPTTAPAAVLGNSAAKPAPAPASTPSSVAPPAAPAAATTTTIQCHNSTNAACGPFRWNPQPRNDPLTVSIASPSSLKAGSDGQFTVTVDDPDAPGRCAYSIDFGDGSPVSSFDNCKQPDYCGTYYGEWSPPQRKPMHSVLQEHHTYSKAGTYTVYVKASSLGDHPSPCYPDPYASSNDRSVPVSVGS